METIKVNMTPNPLDVQTIHASQNDGEARQWEFELHNNGELIDTSDVTEQLVFKAYKGGTEQILPENGSTPTTSPFLGDIKYPQGLLSDQEFTYRESPTESDGLAKITDIKGNTLVWNQLVQNGNFVDGTNNWEAGGSSTISASNGELTVTIGGAWNNDARQNRSLVAGHKYLGIFKVKSDTLRNIGVSLGQFGAVTNVRFASTETLSSTYQTVVGIATITESTSVIRCSLTANASSYVGQTFTIKDVMLFDLTQMGLDISSPSDFTSLFSLPYYAYNQGSLLSFNGTGLKTTGKNQVFKIIEICNIDSTGKLFTDGQGYYDMAVAYVVKGQQYIFSPSHPIEIMGYFLTEPSIGSQTYDRSRITNGTSTFTAQITGYVAIRLNRPETNAQLEFGSTATEYEPYTSTTTSLPISTYFPTGMKSAGTVHDELTETKAINRLIKTVVDGTSKTANYYGTFQGHQLFYIDLFATTYVNVSNMTNLKSNHYLTAGSATMDDRYIRYQTVAYPNINIGRIYWNDDRYTSASEMNTALQSSPLEIVSLAQSETVETFSVASLVTENAEIPLSNDDGALIGKCTEELSSQPGFIDAKIKLTDGDGTCYSNKIQLHVERKPS